MREGNKLTALEVSKKKKRGRYSDGHGLWLQISESGTKAWLFRYMLKGGLAIWAWVRCTLST
jgi:Arm DNA-binding domain